MTIYEYNLQSIKKMHSYMYGCLNKQKSNENNLDNNIQSVITKDEVKSLEVTKDGKVYRLNSSYKPLSEAKKWAEQFNINDTGTIILMFGFGNGIIVRELIKKMTDKEILIIYEPSKEIFSHVIENYDVSDILEDKRIYIEVEDLNPNEFSNILNQNINWINIYLQLFCIHPKYDEIFPDSKKRIMKIISDSNNRAIIHRNTESHFAKSFTSNSIKNLLFIRESNIIKELKEILVKYINIPVIIVSAGPSLDKNIDELRKAKGKSVILAVDTAINYLMKKDILPDIIITVDPNNPIDYYSDNRVKNIPMIIRSESNYEITSWHTGKKIFFEGHEYYDCLYYKLNKEFPSMFTGGSVSTAAFAICSYIGFKKIILIGQDLAYAGGYTHAGNISDRELSKNNSDDMFIEDIYGNQVKTRHDWYHYLTWLIDAIAIVNSKGNEVIDATEGGAKIEGTNIMPLSEAINLYCKEEIDIDYIVKSMTPTIDEKEMEDIRLFIKESIKDLDIIKHKASNSVEILNELIEQYNVTKEIDLSTNNNKKLSDNNTNIEKLSVNNLLNTYIATIATKELLDIYKLKDDDITVKIKPFMINKEINKAKNKMADDIKVMLESILNELYNV